MLNYIVLSSDEHSHTYIHTNTTQHNTTQTHIAVMNWPDGSSGKHYRMLGIQNSTIENQWKFNTGKMKIVACNGAFCGAKNQFASECRAAEYTSKLFLPQKSEETLARHWYKHCKLYNIYTHTVYTLHTLHIFTVHIWFEPHVRALFQ